MREIIAALSRPWAVDERTFNAITAALGGNRDAIEAAKRHAGTNFGGDMIVANGVATIPIRGILAKENDIWASLFGDSTVEGIRAQLEMALDDDEVEAILLDVDSPGGSVAGVSELSDDIFAARNRKPIAAFTDGTMASAAYHLGSSASKVYAARSAEVGSIGVYATVWDKSVALHQEGVKVEIIKAGRFKAVGHPAVPLSDAGRQAIQESVDDFYELFTSAISRNRGLVGEALDHVADGRAWIGTKALELGLIDGLARRGDVIAALAAEGGKRRRNGGRKMSEAIEGTTAAATVEADSSRGPAPTTPTEQRTEAAPAPAASSAAAPAVAPVAIEADPIRAERDRVNAIRAAAFPGQDALVTDLIARGTPKAEAIAELRGHELARMKRDGATSPGASVEDHGVAAMDDGPEKWKREFNASAKLKAEFWTEDGYVAWKQHELSRR